MDEWTCFLFNCLLALIIVLPLAYSLVFSRKMRKWRERSC
jgi:Tfp pilus assembly protein PilO